MLSALVIFDLEFTAWADSLGGRWLAPGEFKEVVQVGAVRLETASLAVTASFDCLVRPRINSVLSDYLQRLTGITNARLAKEGVDFETAYRRFVAFASNEVIASFGHDEWVLDDNIRLYGLKDLPARPQFLELRGWFDHQGVNPDGLHSCDVGPLLGVPFEGQMHDALCDARSIAAGMAVLLQRGAKLSFD
ncbi:MAG TPA: 3'-5' exonuclease [Rhizomicrobium sp.]|jgi:inhibitor of KinA sporulation pathway (predicted exonuclease)|nr:3'-5' exonuclease [Rhizomicrobium sp.]